MRKILLLLPLILLILPIVQADYNITCQRNCINYASPECSNFETTLDIDIDHNWTYNRLTIPNNTNKSQWILTPNSEYASYTDCSFKFETEGSSGGCSGSCEYNYTTTLLNGSDIQPQDYTCTTNTIDNSDCANLGGDDKKVWWDVIIYDSSNGSCAGTPTAVYNGTIFGNCGTLTTISNSFDKNYRYHEYQATDDCYASSGVVSDNSPPTNLDFTCNVPCNGLAYSFYQESDTFSGTPTTSLIWRMDANLTFEGCTNYEAPCLEYGAPQNTTYENGCACANGQTDTGLFCEEANCNQTCTGSVTEQTINTNNTFQEVLDTQDPVQILEFSKDSTTDFVKEISNGVLPILGIFVIGIFVFMIALIFYDIVTGGRG